jgi:predicted nucleic acid-binding protein
MIYALDANILSYIIRGDGKVVNRFERENAMGNDCMIPIVAFYEVKRGIISTYAEVKLSMLNRLCETLKVDELTASDVNTACRIYADRKARGLSLGDADILIAAQALCRGYTLVTNNTKHFEAIEGLRVVNWA